MCLLAPCAGFWLNGTSQQPEGSLTVEDLSVSIALGWDISIYYLGLACTQSGQHAAALRVSNMLGIDGICRGVCCQTH